MTLRKLTTAALLVMVTAVAGCSSSPDKPAGPSKVSIPRSALSGKQLLDKALPNSEDQRSYGKQVTSLAKQVCGYLTQGAPVATIVQQLGSQDFGPHFAGPVDFVGLSARYCAQASVPRAQKELNAYLKQQASASASASASGTSKEPSSGPPQGQAKKDVSKPACDAVRRLVAYGSSGAASNISTPEQFRARQTQVDVLTRRFIAAAPEERVKSEAQTVLDGNEALLKLVAKDTTASQLSAHLQEYGSSPTAAKSQVAQQYLSSWFMRSCAAK